MNITYLDIVSHPSQPTLDPVIIDWEGKSPDAGIVAKVYDIIHLIADRSYKVGLVDPIIAVVCRGGLFYYMRDHLDTVALGIKVIPEEFVESTTVYVITRSVNGRSIIHPPYKDAGKVMSWHEYWSRIESGEELRLMIEMPWLQGKIINIGV